MNNPGQQNTGEEGKRIDDRDPRVSPEMVSVSNQSQHSPAEEGKQIQNNQQQHQWLNESKIEGGSEEKHTRSTVSGEAVKDDVSQLYRDKYAEVMRDFHNGDLRGQSNTVVRESDEANAMAADQARKFELSNEQPVALPR